ncbi:RecA RecA/RadA recombinase [uncultured Caudovirales phage]|uniref:RecA RecA/RadA recombinase n=1 Tax=uncultured Caudovirales phage TaxID=2100421 RepID=A0A6J5N149_9CAUD|nr:RecA RecA/RadA recombinase [uncultured Caudovirales phage]CAB4151020.1 RecA RecA/RadA recombinase [uncultured Caudovirales phage]CAB4174517.1 RecA RecA/RadA recombinase [uncultured Caudovirales phage]CAB4179834.1 RecA RecA/RadA recombinase [uncultured Caudovirales phage]CAB4185433.1 RecA RecA/RadA recombinase [uncultured Caudovirales phage]
MMVAEEILAKLDPKTRQRVQTAEAVDAQKQQTPSIGLNLALKGGFGHGRQVLVWGNKSAGKSSFCLQMIALAQKEGKTCAWIDAENSYSQDWAEKLGVDSSQLIYSAAKTINDMVDVAVQLMDAGVDIIVVDSISALLPAIYFEKDGEELKNLQDTKQIGAEAKDMTHAVKMLNYANKNTLLVLISQQRNSFGSMHASHIPTGGMAVKFFSSTVIKLWASEAEANSIKSGVQVGDKIIEQRVGRPVNWIIDYNKLGPPNLSGQYDFYYQGKVLGIDYVGEILDTAEMIGAINRGGSWYTIEEERFQGRNKTLEYLREHPEIVEKLKEKISNV